MPAFLTMMIMPLAVSITDGIAFGFIAMVVLKAATGRARELDSATVIFAAALSCVTRSNPAQFEHHGTPAFMVSQNLHMTALHAFMP